MSLEILSEKSYSDTNPYKGQEEKNVSNGFIRLNVHLEGYIPKFKDRRRNKGLGLYEEHIIIPSIITIYLILSWTRVCKVRSFLFRPKNVGL